jgi:hypothetical protein
MIGQIRKKAQERSALAREQVDAMRMEKPIISSSEKEQTIAQEEASKQVSAVRGGLPLTTIAIGADSKKR